MALAQWLDIIQTACVVFALVGLIVQLNLAARTAKAAAYQSVVTQLQSFHDRLSDSEDAQLLKEALAPNLDITPREMVFALSLLNLLESAHFQHAQGVIPRELWSGWQDQIAVYFRLPFFQEFWRRNRDSYNAKFRAVMDVAETRAEMMHRGAAATRR